MQNRFRKQFRLSEYDYSGGGAYFVTICTSKMVPYFGYISHGKVILSPIGVIARRFWLEIPDRFGYTSIDEFVIMPNHMHGIIMIGSPDRKGTPGHSSDQSKSVNTICRGLINQTPTGNCTGDKDHPVAPTETRQPTGRGTPRRLRGQSKPANTICRGLINQTPTGAKAADKILFTGPTETNFQNGRGTPGRARFRNDPLVTGETTLPVPMDTPRHSSDQSKPANTICRGLINQTPTGAKASIKNNPMMLAGTSLGAIIRHYKARVTYEVHRIGFPDFAWQRLFFDHVIRNERSLNKIRHYIRHNPIHWECDRDYPENLFS